MNTVYTETLLSAVRAWLPTQISGKRLAHTYAVEEECTALAARFGRFPALMTEEDGMKLRLAALLHDVTKEKTHEEQLALCKEYRLPLTPYEAASPKVLHSKTAPAYARAHLHTYLGYTCVDEDVSRAIFTHTTGSANMSLLGKLLYLADYIEPTRTFSDCVELRRLFYSDIERHTETPGALLAHLDDIMIASLDMTVSDLLECGSLIDPNTTEARNALIYSRMKP